MSATLKIILKKNKKNKDGLYPLYIRVTKDRVTRFLALGITLREDQWDEVEKKVKRNYKNSTRVNHLIAKRIEVLSGKAVDWEIANKSIKHKSIKREINKNSDESFTRYFDEYLKRLRAAKKLGTLDKALATYSKLHTYANSDNLLFRDIDVEFLKSIEIYFRVELENRINTIHGNLKMMRKLFNDAVSEELIPYELNPFPKYKLKTEKTNKEYLTEAEIVKLEECDLTGKTRLDDTRKMFLFACNAGGIRVSDLLQLKWKQFTGTHVAFVQQKTNDQNAIKLPVKALEILESYKGITDGDTNNYIFPFLHNDIHPDKIFDAISSNTAYANKNLKDIAKLAEIEKKLSMHVSRHTWATRALRKGMRIENVSKLMGHSSIKTTQVYTKIVNVELDKAMEVFDE